MTGALPPRPFDTQTNEMIKTWRRVVDAAVTVCLRRVFSSSSSAARYVGLGSRTERQSEGESNRERHAGSDGQSGHFTGR